MKRAALPVALTIAGSDSGGGAGIQADLKTFAAHGVYGTSALTLVTAQNTRGVQRAAFLDPELVAAQIQAVLDDFPVAAVKTGALGTRSIVEAVAQTLKPAGLPLVVDPVILAKSGDVLMETDALDALHSHLLPLAALVTPNRPEAEMLLGLPAGQWADEAHITALTHTALPFPLLLKGGHATGSTVCDHLLLPGHRETLTAPRQATRHTHGTGCTLSAAITANLARGWALPRAVREAQAYLQDAIRQAPGLGHGAGPLEHFPKETACP